RGTLGGRHPVMRRGLERVERVDELHHRADRVIEVETPLDVLLGFGDRLVDRPTKRDACFRCRAQRGWGGLGAGGSPQRRWGGLGAGGSPQRRWGGLGAGGNPQRRWG